jgi:hypothetical protein
LKPFDPSRLCAKQWRRTACAALRTWNPYLAMAGRWKYVKTLERGTDFDGPGRPVAIVAGPDVACC